MDECEAIGGRTAFLGQTILRRLTIKKHDGGEGGIRTHGTLTGTPHFECGAIDHSTTSPHSLSSQWQPVEGFRAKRRRDIAMKNRERKQAVKILIAGCGVSVPAQRLVGFSRRLWRWCAVTVPYQTATDARLIAAVPAGHFIPNSTPLIALALPSAFFGQHFRFFRT